MTPTEAYAFYGDSISCTYYNGSDYVNATLVPSSSRRVYYRASTGDVYGQDFPSWLGADSNMQYVYYYCVASDYSSNPSYLGLDISPNVHFSGCTDFRFAAFAYCGNNRVPNTSAGYSDSFIYVNNLRFSNAQNVSAAGWYPAIPMTRSGSSGVWSCFGVWADFHSDVITSANLLRVGFNGARLDGNELGVYLSLPQYNTGATPETGTAVPGTTTTTSAGSSGGDVNLTETNGLISSVISAITNLPNTIMQGLRNLFIPDDDFMDDFKDDMQDLLEDHLGGLYEAVTLLTDMFDDLPSVTAKQSIYIPACHIPLAGTDFVLGDWTVPLKVSGLPNIFYEGIAFITDFLATMAFLNMCRRKLEIFLNPDSEVIQS